MKYKAGEHPRSYWNRLIKGVEIGKDRTKAKQIKNRKRSAKGKG